jgi:hypothetical protein
MFTETMIDQMRRELENPELMKKRIEKERQENEFIENTRKRFAAEGRDLDQEFEDHIKNR